MNIHEHAERNFYINPPGWHAKNERTWEQQEKKESDEKVLAEKVMRETGCTIREFWSPNLSVRDRQIIAGLLVVKRTDLAILFLENPKTFREQHRQLIKKAMSLLNSAVDKETIPENLWEHVVSDDE
ncbi:MAG TPA: hypothetical protein VJ246_02305 [Patescibacteria group bacterium]|nr:hypothetical protein [Patescibacteria group bacterium]